MSRIAFLGLGRMGSQMALRLLNEGHQLTVWDRTAVPAELLDAGADPAATPADAARSGEIVITMLTDGAVVEAVLFGPDGAAEGVGPQAVLADMSTIGPDAVATIRDRLAPHVRFIDAPVQGSTPKAQAGELVIFAGGSADDVDDCRAAFDSLGTVRHVGPLGTGASIKLVVNLVLGTSTVMIGEALRLADRLHLDTEAVLDALAGTAVAPLVPRVRARLSDPDAPTQFPIRLAGKDLRLVAEAGGTDDGAVAGAERVLAAATRAGYGDADITVVPAFLRT
jgi:3-hydroxyisobutyrate dehydrogenase